MIGRARRVDDGVKMNAALEELPAGHPFYSVNGVWKAVMFDTDLIGEVLLLGGKSSPALAAGAMHIVHDTSLAAVPPVPSATVNSDESCPVVPS